MIRFVYGLQSIKGQRAKKKAFDATQLSADTAGKWERRETGNSLSFLALLSCFTAKVTRPQFTENSPAKEREEREERERKS